MTCTVPVCTSRVGVFKENNGNISFHRFPMDINLKETLIKNVRKGDDWRPSQHTRICSMHFEDSCFREGYRRKFLHSYAVPTIFPNLPSSCKPVIIAALVAVCGAAKLDRSYLPPHSAQTAGGSPGAIQTPFNANSSPRQGNQGLGGIPVGGYNNDFQGVVVDAVAGGSRATEDGETGLGAPRPSYGSQNSKVGDAAFESPQTAGFRVPVTVGNTQNHLHNGFNGGIDAQIINPQIDQSSFASHGGQPERANAEKDRNAGITRYEQESDTDTYNYAFETDNGIKSEESGIATNGVQAQGGFSYISDDGQTFSVTYTADENGYKPVGAHLPTPPPIPKEILLSLEKNAQDEAAGLNDDGSYDAQKYNAGSDYNESDNINGQYNRVQSNKGSGNGAVLSSDATASGTFIQSSAQSLNQPLVNTINTDASINELDHNKKQSGIFNRFNRPSADFNNAESTIQASSTVTSDNAFGHINPAQSSQAFANVNKNNAFSQSTSGSIAASQSPSTNDNNIVQQQQNQGAGFGSNKFGYLAPFNAATGTKQTFDKESQSFNTNGNVPSASFPSQQYNQASNQNMLQQFVNSQALIQTTVSQPSPTLSTPFPKPVSNIIETQNRFMQQSQSFTRQPNPTISSNQENSDSNCCGKQLPQKPSIYRPDTQSFNQQIIPQQEKNNFPQIPSGASAVASFSTQSNSQTTNFDNNADNFPQFQSQQVKQPTGQQEINVLNRFQQTTQNNGQFSSNTQTPLSQNTFGTQQQSSSFAPTEDNSYYYKQPSQPFRIPNGQHQQSGNSFSSTSFNQFNRVTPQPSVSTQTGSQSSTQQNLQSTKPNFENQQPTTRYPRPSTLAPTSSNVPSQQEAESSQATFQPQQYNGVTQASASSFSSLPQLNIQQQQQQYTQRPSAPVYSQQQLNSRFNMQKQEYSQTQNNLQPQEQTQTSFQTSKPTPAFSQQITTLGQSFQRPTSTPNQPDQKSLQQQSQHFGQRQSFTVQLQDEPTRQPSTESALTQQYDGEVYEYNKPAETLPPQDSTPQGSNQMSVPKEIPEQNELKANPNIGRPQNQFDAQPKENSKQQFNTQQNQFGKQQSQFGSQENQISSQQNQFSSQENQISSQQNQFGSQQNQISSQQNQISSQQNQFSSPQNRFGSQKNQFGSKFVGAQQSSSPVAGQGEVFSGSRQPPSFDTETGYHY